MSTALTLMRTTAIIIAVVIVLSFGVDSVLRGQLSSKVSVDYLKGTSKSSTLIVYLPGILASAKNSSVDLIGIWRHYGDVYLVEYGDNRFSGSVIVRLVSNQIIRRQRAAQPYRRIVFIGSSMGGLLAYDVIRSLRKSLMVTPIELIALDAPTGAADFQPPNNLVAPILRLLPFGPIWNKLNLVSKMFVPPKEVNIEPGVNRAELARRVGEGKNYRLSFWRDELCYIMGHGALRPGSLVGQVYRLTYVRSIRDNDTVRATAYNAWAATTPIATRVEVDSTHVGFAERPKTWQQAFRKLLG